MDCVVSYKCFRGETMESHAFDALSRAFANGVPRRTVLKTLAAGCFYGVFRPILGIRTAIAAPTCAQIDACIKAADDEFDRQVQDCQEITHPESCRVAARKRHDVAIRACGPCPSGTRCESDVCCPNDQATCAPPCKATRTDDGSTLQSTVTSTVRGAALIVTTSQRIPSPVSRNELGQRPSP